MTIRCSKRWFVLGALLLLTPVFASAVPSRPKGCDFRNARKCHQVPDGGSGFSYLLAVGTTCLGAAFMRSRVGKNPNS